MKQTTLITGNGRNLCGSPSHNKHPQNEPVGLGRAVSSSGGPRTSPAKHLKDCGSPEEKMASTPGNAVLSGIEIRTATCQDLPKIHGLVRDSFASMETHTPGTSIPWDTWASDLIAAELYEADFKRIYLEPEDNNFWVAESGELGGVVGCVGVGVHNCSPGRLSPEAVVQRWAGRRMGFLGPRA